MKRAFGYFRLQLKRFFKLMPVVLLLSALLIAAIGLAFFGLVSDSDSDEQNSLLKIGIVVDEDDDYMDMALDMLRNLDTSRFSLSTLTIREESTAADMLRRGELVAYLVFSDNFITEAIHGRVNKITCVTASGAVDFGSRAVDELMHTVTEMVANAQKSLFGFQNAAIVYGMDKSLVYRIGDDAAMDVIDLILRREASYRIEEIGTGGTQGIDDPLICGMLIMVLMLWGITCCTIFCSRSGALNRVLCAKGTGAAAQVLGEYAAYFIFMTAVIAAFAAVIFAASPFLPAITMLEDYDFGRLIPGLIVPLLTISAMQFFLYELTGGPVSSALLQFFCAMGMGYISGCIYPVFFFPRPVQDAAAWLPSWSCRLWLDELLAGRPSLSTFAVLTAYFAAFLILGVLVRRVRIRREGGAA